MQQEAARKAHQEKYDKWSIENAQADEKFNEMMRSSLCGNQPVRRVRVDGVEGARRFSTNAP